MWGAVLGPILVKTSSFLTRNKQASSWSLEGIVSDPVLLKTNSKAVTAAPLTHGKWLNHINSALPAWPYSSVPGNPHASPGSTFLHGVVLWKHYCCPEIFPQSHPEQALAEPRSTCNGKFIVTCFILAGCISLGKKRHRARIKASVKLTTYIKLLEKWLV